MSQVVSTGKRVGYVRVSTPDQNPARQLADVALDKVFTEAYTGKTADRPQLQAMLSYIREGDSVFVHSIDRLARNLRDLQNLIDEMLKKDVTVFFVKENLLFDKGASPISKFLFQVMGALAEFERTLIRERQMEGIRIARASHKFKGAKPALDDAGVVKLKEMIALGISKSRLAKQFGISRVTLYKYSRKCEHAPALPV